LKVKQTVYFENEKPLQISTIVSVPEGCESIRNLRNPSGVYLKTLCTKSAGKSYDNFVAYCIANGMEMLTVGAATEVETAFIAVANDRYDSGWLWVTGKFGTLCNVYRRVSKTTSFVSTQATCSQNYYSYCSYTSKNFKFLP
jgi:hypothetical protein